MSIATSEEEYKKRLEICRGCEWLKQIPLVHTEQCGKCGCFLVVKARLAGAQCPLGKWNQF